MIVGCLASRGTYRLCFLDLPTCLLPHALNSHVLMLAIVVHQGAFGISIGHTIISHHWSGQSAKTLVRS